MSLEVSGFLGTIFFLLVIWAIYKIVNSTASTAKKVIWIVVILLLPLVGFIAWLLIGPKG